jgi:hypothetical protein
MSIKKIILAAIALLLVTTSSQNAISDSPILPLAKFTPGSVNPNVTQLNLNSTICVSGYTKSIRPSSSYTTALKITQLATTYSLYKDNVTGDFEEDHLISLELGGSPTDVKNLWPEPYSSATGARIKDKIENKLHALVCSGQLSLKTAQKAIASNWFLAYQKYIGLVVSKPRDLPTNNPLAAPQATETSSSAAVTTPSIPAGATGQCKDGTYSYATTHQGMCSRHGGVAQFYS